MLDLFSRGEVLVHCPPLSCSLLMGLLQPSVAYHPRGCSPKRQPMLLLRCAITTHLTAPVPDRAGEYTRNARCLKVACKLLV